MKFCLSKQTKRMKSEERKKLELIETKRKEKIEKQTQASSLYEKK